MVRSIVQPGNAGLSGTVPFIQFPLLAKTADGKTARIPNLKGCLSAHLAPHTCTWYTCLACTSKHLAT
jgi:hypothetical protein